MQSEGDQQQQQRHDRQCQLGTDILHLSHLFPSLLLPDNSSLPVHPRVYPNKLVEGPGQAVPILWRVSLGRPYWLGTRRLRRALGAAQDGNCSLRLHGNFRGGDLNRRGSSLRPVRGRWRVVTRRCKRKEGGRIRADGLPRGEGRAAIKAVADKVYIDTDAEQKDGQGGNTAAPVSMPCTATPRLLHVY